MIRRYLYRLRALLHHALLSPDRGDVDLTACDEMRRRVLAASKAFPVNGAVRPSVLVTMIVDFPTRSDRSQFARLVRFCRHAAASHGSVGWLDRSRLAVLIPDASAAAVSELIHGLADRWRITGHAESLGRFGGGSNRWHGVGYEDGEAQRLRDYRPLRPGVRRRLGRRLVKRGCDAVVAAIGLIVLSPIILLLALTVKLSSPGPILSSDRRFGRRGRPCRIYRFRDRAAEPLEVSERSDIRWRLESDDELVEAWPRTPVGNFLHDTPLGRLPQLWNVLRGDLSL